jgi:glycosyltransferase involved in cell wall biosynthesis
MNGQAVSKPVAGPVERTVLIANPSPDVYGADLQMLQSVRAMKARGWRVVVALPADGALVPRLQALEAEVVFVSFPVLRRANASIMALIRMLVSAARSVPRVRRLIRSVGAGVVYVNTVTLPWWLLAARLARTPSICHLHEAETEGTRLLRKVLMLPLRLASAVIVISRSAFDAMTDVAPGLRGRARLVYNGVPMPPKAADAVIHDGSWRLLVVGRLSPRKAPDLALEAVARLRSAGRDVVLEVAGTTFEGYEWYEDQLRERANEPDLQSAVHWSGYCSPIWPVLARSDIVVAPSLREPFGNAVVEAQMALRPVVATAAQGHLESIDDGESGLLVAPGDVAGMASAISRLMDDRGLFDQLAQTAQQRAIERFSTQRYAQQVTELVDELAVG